MNIALVVHDLHEHGGHSLYTRRLADELSRRHEVAVFANYCERPIEARWSFRPVRAWRANSLSCVQTFPLGVRLQHGALSRFEIQHAQGFCGGRPNVVTAHRCMAAYVKSLSSVSLRHRASLRMMLAAEAHFYKNYDGAVIAVSRQIAGELEEFYGRERGTIRVIPHGVDSVRFASANRKLYRDRLREELGIGTDATVAFYAGDLTKAHAHLKELGRAAPDVQILITTATASYHWSAPNVRILPLTHQIERYYAAADAFIFPTANDPFGMVVLEAMASGLPVFCSDRAGAAELITPGRDGFVAPLNDWVEATAAGLNDRESLLKVGRAAEQTARRHDWASVVTAVEQLYYEVARSTPALEGDSAVGNGRPSRKPSLAVLYGQPDRLSTSFQTRQLVRALERWLNPLPLHVKSEADSAWRDSLHRVSSNYLKPLLKQPVTDYVFYANDGVADLNQWRAKRVLYWYDAPWDWSKKPPSWRQLVHRLRYRNLLAADHVFAVSQVQVEVATRLRRGREGSVTYLPVGVDCRVFDPAAADPERIRKKFKLPAKTIIGYLGYLGIWRERFAGEPLIEIAPELLRQHDVHFLIVGSGPAFGMFRQRVERAGLSGHFTFTGFVPEEWLPDCLAAMDISVDTLEEGFHSEARSETKLKQYMAMGRACVATAIGENCVDLNDGECGVLVEPGSDGLLYGVAALCDQPELRARLGSAARRRAVEIYDWPVLAERVASALGLVHH